jgi:hypothetical protein
LFQQVATALSSTACDGHVPASLLYRLMEPTDLSRLVDNLAQADKINNLRQAYEISGCVANVIYIILNLK